MGILSWWSGGKEAPATSSSETKQISSDPKTGKSEVVSSDMNNNGAMEVTRRPDDFTVFEFGSAVDKVTLAGYCSVSEELEPCRWEILPGTGSDAPQFRNSHFLGVNCEGMVCRKTIFSSLRALEEMLNILSANSSEVMAVLLFIADDRKRREEWDDPNSGKNL